MDKIETYMNENGDRFDSLFSCLTVARGSMQIIDNMISVFENEMIKSLDLINQARELANDAICEGKGIDGHTRFSESWTDPTDRIREYKTRLNILQGKANAQRERLLKSYGTQRKGITLDDLRKYYNENFMTAPPTDSDCYLFMGEIEKGLMNGTEQITADFFFDGDIEKAREYLQKQIKDLSDKNR